ncbi:hypothetical protein ACFFHM_03210 [Halalkalibacter kiskunsagensis]|uniref:Uncharacterized protein n=1 Tax=Halalkalibacter kiskunsagensis TaxID=1548599 RepID=A0ABV6K8G7_9BACI
MIKFKPKKQWERKMMDEMESALKEKGYEYEKHYFGDLIVNPNETNGMMYVIGVFDKKGYLLSPHIMKTGDPEIGANYSCKTWTPSDPADLIEWMEGINKDFLKMVDYIRIDLDLEPLRV